MQKSVRELTERPDLEGEKYIEYLKYWLGFCPKERAEDRWYLYMSCGVEYLNIGKYAQAIDNFDCAISIKKHPDGEDEKLDFVVLYKNLAIAHIRHEYETNNSTVSFAALAYFNLAIKILGSSYPEQLAYIYKSCGDYYLNQKKYQEAIGYYSPAINICPQDSKEQVSEKGNMYAQRGIINNHLGLHEKAVHDLNEALKRFDETESSPKKMARCLYYRALSNVEVGNFDQALEDMARSQVFGRVVDLDGFAGQVEERRSDDIPSTITSATALKKKMVRFPV
jgi:tetratricopeptide (TPR) repeat protein